MFGQNTDLQNTPQQQDNNSANLSTANFSNTGTSIGGYSSPYLSKESTPQTNNTPFNAENINTSPISQPNELISSPNNQELLQSTNTPISDPDKQFVSNPSPSNFEDNLLNKSAELNVQNVETLSADFSIPTVASLNPAPALNDSGLNPNEDLNIRETQIVPQELRTTSSDSKEDITIKFLLDLVIEKNASDLHLTVGYPAMIRIDGKLQNVGHILSPEEVQGLINQTLTGNQKELLEVNKEVDLSYSHEGKGRFRVNAYNERGNLAAAYRLIPTKIKSIEELNLPKSLYDFTQMSQGLFLVTGPTGSGKSTTLAGMLQEINNNYSKHIITIEDPIEYVYPKARALVDQRELGEDTHDWGIALRSILRQDPDVVLIGEMRDFETIQAAITTAETGHLVFATLHTNSAAQSIDRIIDVFPPHQQEQIRTQLSGALKGILSQRLIPKIGGGREAATELMIVNPAIQNLIREGKTYQIDNIISTSFDIGMMTLERALVRMVREGKITIETAQEYAIRPEEVLKIMKSGI